MCPAVRSGHRRPWPANGRRSDAALLVKLTGYTIQSIRYVTGKLIEDGLIRRVPRSDNRVLWEAVK